MSELPKENQELDKDVDQSRRKLAKIGAATPVIMTLASKPVFGAQCLSQMMSGNASQQGSGTCVYGWSPGGWKSPNGTVAGFKPAINAWPAALSDLGFGTTDLAYGELTGNNKNKCGDYSGGALFSAVFTGADDTPMREIFCDESSATINGAKKTHWIAAYLNSKVVDGYILSTEQVLAYWNDPGLEPPAPFTSLTDFFDYTWNGGTHGNP